MLTITAGQVSAFNNPSINELFNKPFPAKDAFRLMDLVKQIQGRLPSYNEAVKKAIESNGGVISENGAVAYPTPADQTKAAEAIQRLNEAEIELTGEKLEAGEDWPSLTIAEVAILSPIIK